MIYEALEILRSEISDYLKSLPELNVAGNTVVSMTNVAKDDGTVDIPNNNIGLTLVNIEEERLVRDVTPHRINPDNSVSHLNPEIRLNLLVLFVAHFNDYKTSLQYISGLIRFFQRKTVFTPDNSPSMPDGIEKLVVDLHQLNFEQQNNLWAVLGAKYLPSVLYKVRAIKIQEGQAKDLQTPITSIKIVGKGKEAG
ncbi:Protein of unknown function [Malonomonas rubra DSM 5091]|uniref:Pvc16 N-terminal domain-containing protein n=1 Tax=Malonomonas rubra DSM 5091 TaxID=1122189 RepID=A0A1M6M180_MALRU|nr:DUF4255 domain-containing protein [Malonomonas rubra]SHJ77110.1 Protein of unknown function [Malonomonas rubra DSM 5091]